jgi:hypothetical protein
MMAFIYGSMTHTQTEPRLIPDTLRNTHKVPDKLHKKQMTKNQIPQKELVAPMIT